MTATTAAEIKLLKMWHTDGHGLRARGTDGSTHAYETEDGRFRVYRPESGRMTDGWGVEDTQRWAWHFNSRDGGPAVIAEHDYFAQQQTLAACKQLIGRIYERGEANPQTYAVYATEAEALAAGEATLVERHELHLAQQRAKAEAERTPTAGPMTIRRLSIGMGTHKIEDANGDEVARAGKVGDARVMAVASEMLALLEEMDAGLWFGPDSPQASRVLDLVRRAHGA